MTSTNVEKTRSVWKKRGFLSRRSRSINSKKIVLKPSNSLLRKARMNMSRFERSMKSSFKKRRKNVRKFIKKRSNLSNLMLRRSTLSKKKRVYASRN